MRPDNRPDSARRIADMGMTTIRRLDAAQSRREVVAIHAEWCDWADRNRVCRQIREHMNEKAAGLKAEFVDDRRPPASDRRSEL